MRNRWITLAVAGTVSDRFSALRRSPDCTSRGLEIMTAVLSRLPPAKQRSEVSVKILKSPVHLLESRSIHFPASPVQTFPNYPVVLSYQQSL